MRTHLQANVGDTIRIEYNVIEEGVERRQTFEGILIKVRGSGTNKSITVRRMSFGVGVERIFPVASPRFLGLRVLREGRVRRSKLYYLRKLSGKAHRVESTEVVAEAPAAKVPAAAPKAVEAAPVAAKAS